MLSPKEIILGLLWLPLTFVLFGVLRDYSFFQAPFFFNDLQFVLIHLILPAFLGLPLVLIKKLIANNGYSVTSWVTFALLAPVTFIFVLFAGLLGPIGMVIATLIACIPALIVYFVTRYMHHHKKL